MTFWQVTALVLLVLVLTPIVVYVSLKLGAYGWHRGKFLFDRDYPHQSQGDRPWQTPGKNARSEKNE